MKLSSVIVLALATVVSLGGGIMLLWASQSWHVLVWASVKTLFPGTQLVMVNTEATLGRREQFGLPEDLVHNIALRALVVDGSQHVVATVWREGYFQAYPEPTGPDAKSAAPLFDPVIIWSKAFWIFGWVLAAVGLLQLLPLLYLLKRESR